MGNYLGNLSQSPVKEGVGAEPTPSDVQAFEKSLCKLEALAGMPANAPSQSNVKAASAQELAALDGLVRRLELVADKKQPQ